jgi:hypothetical protein
MGRIWRSIKRARFRSLYRGDYLAEGERSVENTDAFAATGGFGAGLDPQGGPGHASFPPNYLKTDDGRPRR